ncbi:type II CAAX prenyl endopeptidase Rce1 family protein [Rothia sp. CCM 9418]|uniref:CPBP family glutamic-type intramembrane protease n=1 Tax=unclassified Rothia (in: high G+C Gram-positive bacteria) TaxID=2689056 RepID=UPI003AC27B54
MAVEQQPHRENIHIPWQQKNQQENSHKPAPQQTPQPAVGQPFIYHVPVEERTLAYHRLSHADPRTRWWSPLAEGLLGGLFYLGFSIALGIAFASILGPQNIALNLQSLQSLALKDPLIFALVFGSVALLYPSMFLARLVTGPKPWGLVHSVYGKIRWSWMGFCFAIAIIGYIVLPMLINALGESVQAPDVESPGKNLVWLLVLVFTITPIQCYAEELVFRGYLMQTLGRWIRNPIIVITLPAVLFMLGHRYDFWAQMSVLTMGLVAGFLTWKTGGLEAGIALHVVNNLWVMFMGSLGLADPFAQEGSTAGEFLGALSIQLIIVLIVMLSARKMGIHNTQTFSVAMTHGKSIPR